MHGQKNIKLSLHVQCPIFLSGSVRYQSSRKSVRWEVSW